MSDTSMSDCWSWDDDDPDIVGFAVCGCFPGNDAWTCFNSDAVKGAKSGGSWTWTTQGEYRYNPNGMMVKSVQGGTTTYYVYRGHNPLFEKTGATSTYYVYTNGRMFAKLVGAYKYYYIRDALGSTR